MRRHVFLIVASLMLAAFPWGLSQVHAQNAIGAAQDAAAPPPTQMRSMTHAEHAAAAVRARAARAAATASAGQTLESTAQTAAMPAMPAPGGTPNYFGPEPNWAWTPIIPKFVDGLPGLGPLNANGLVTPGGDPAGQYIPVANPDTVTFPGSDYYELNLVQYQEKMSSSLPPTTLRGYVQVNNGTNPAVAHPTLADNTVAPAPVHYLGPLIVAQKDRPVRIKFNNMLDAAPAGDLFIPVDESVMGAGMGPDMIDMYTQNRGTLHLHGGHTPWISDRTPHQWTTPATETSTIYTRGDSVQFVPDMWFNPTTHAVVPVGAAMPPGATNDPGAGSMTFYYTN
jgi:hypothetical protein